jgi:hypothetical protein
LTQRKAREKPRTDSVTKPPNAIHEDNYQITGASPACIVFIPTSLVTHAESIDNVLHFSTTKPVTEKPPG